MFSDFSQLVTLHKLGEVHFRSARMLFMKRQRVKDLLLRAGVVVRTSNMKISRRRLADTLKIRTKKRAVRAARLFFLIQPIKSLICGVVVAVVIS